MEERKPVKSNLARKKLSALTGWLIINAILIFLLIKTFSPASFSLSTFEFIPLLGRCQNIFISDLDHDGTEDVALTRVGQPLPYEKNLQIFSPFLPTGYYKYRYFLDTSIEVNDFLLPPADLDDDEEMEIPIIRFNEKKTTLNIHNPIGQIKKVINFEESFGHDQFPGEVCFEDLDNDGQKEMVMAILSRFSGLPRAITVWDIARGRLRWKYLMGCMPDLFEVADINQDGMKEIVVMGRAPHNGVSVNGTDDDHSYIFSLDNKGNLLWRLVLGGYYTRWWLKCFDMDQDGQLEIIGSKGCDRETDPEPGEIRLIEARTGGTENLFTESVSYSEIFLLPRENGETHLVVGDSSGHVTIFDRHLNILRRIKVDFPAVVKGVSRLGKDARKNYIFVQAGFTRFLIFNENLKNIFNYKLDYFFDIVALSFHSFHKQDEYAGLLNASQLYLLKKMTKPLPEWLVGIIRSKFIAHIFFFVLINVLFVYLFRLQNRTLLQLTPIQLDWLDQAQEIAHRMKNSLFTIQLQAENLKLETSKHPDEGRLQVLQSIAQSILDDINLLGRQTRILMKLLAPRPLNLKTTEINGLIQKVVNKYLGYYQGKIDFVLDLESESTALAVDEEQLEEALNNLIANALDAMPQGGRLTLRTTVLHSSSLQEIKGIEIEIEDSGQGIPDELLSEIFKPGFSTKKEGLGLGLAITKRIIEAHGGRISVHSKAGVGTKFAIFLPWKQY